MTDKEILEHLRRMSRQANAYLSATGNYPETVAIGLYSEMRILEKNEIVIERFKELLRQSKRTKR